MTEATNTTWDLLIKNCKNLEVAGLENLKYAEFLTVKNRVVSRPPFILICKNTQFDTVQDALEAGVTLDNFN